MNEEERYLFDLWGYLVVEDVLSKSELVELTDLISHQNDAEPNNDDIYSQRFGGYLQLESDAFRNLLNHPRIMPYLKALIGDGFRLDHTYGIVMRKGNLGLNLHSGGTPYNPSEYYVCRNGQMYNGLTVASWALTDMLPGHGGFCCIPGSHKSNFSCPPQLKTVTSAPQCMKGIHQKAGDVAIFTEALTHGTLQWEADHPRLSILVKYSPGHASWSQKQYPDEMRAQMNSEAQRLLLEPPYVHGRKPVVN
jgi:hypothetical protein